jgi:hypothetical protein
LKTRLNRAGGGVQGARHFNKLERGRGCHHFATSNDREIGKKGKCATIMAYFRNNLDVV